VPLLSLAQHVVRHESDSQGTNGGAHNGNGDGLHAQHARINSPAYPQHGKNDCGKLTNDALNEHKEIALAFAPSTVLRFGLCLLDHKIDQVGSEVVQVFQMDNGQYRRVRVLGMNGQFFTVAVSCLGL